MIYVLSWFVVLLLLALWSLAAWGLHALALWTVSQAGEVSVDASVFGGLSLTESWLAWLPPYLVEGVNALLASLGPIADSVLQAMPSLAGVLTLGSLTVWGLGCGLLLLLGVGLHVLLALWRRRRGGGPPPAAQAIAAG